MTTIARSTELLTDQMLTLFDARSPAYDRENRFFQEDFDDLRASGYLNAALPPEFGGPGLKLAEVVKLQRRLAYYAPATAIAINMHLYWTGVAADLYRSGDHSCDWVLEEASRGKIFASGHSESGNDMPIFLSTTKAERVAGGWELTGRKIFGSLSPVWNYLGVHAMDTSDPENPRIVHAFISREDAGYRIEETWDTLGMRATQSHDTVLEHAFIPDERVALVCPTGFAGASLFHLAVFAWALIGFASVYSGVAQRAFDISTASVKKRSSIALTRSMAYHPEVQHEVAEMRMALETMDAFLERVAQDWSDGADHGHDWPVKIISVKHVVTKLGWQVVDTALELSGGSGIFKRSRMEQIFRDARLGRFHPANSALAHEVVGKLSLGISPDEQPRWG